MISPNNSDAFLRVRQCFFVEVTWFMTADAFTRHVKCARQIVSEATDALAQAFGCELPHVD
jgi:hypothetical protein